MIPLDPAAATPVAAPATSTASPAAAPDRPEAPATALLLSAAFASALSPRARIVTPRDGADYTAARQVWNGAIQRFPAALVYAGDAGDVQHAVRFARAHGMPFAVRAGGHSIPGRCLVDDGLVLDLSQLRGIRVAPAARTVVVEAGCLLRDVDHATAAHGLAVPAGTVSDTGVAGLTLGGGYGWLSRMYGLTVDSVLEMDVVLADGSFATINDNNMPDLFWAMRGAGTNFAVATSITYRAYPVDRVLSFQLIFPFAVARDVAPRWFEIATTVPRELSVNVHFVTLPTGDRMLSLGGLYVGDEEAGRKAIEPLLAFGTPVMQRIEYIPFSVHQRGADSLAPHGAHYYVKAGNLDVTPEIVERAISLYEEAPRGAVVLGFSHTGGKVNETDPQATPVCYRNESITLEMITSWAPDAPETQRTELRDWCRRAYDGFRGDYHGVYNNFVEGFDDRSEDDMVRVAYGPNVARLREIKAKYDPTNLFKGNINIKPGK